MELLKKINDTKIIIALIILQLAVTLPFINSFPIDLDEPFSIFYAQQNVSEIIAMLGNENNPPLHFLALHFWIKMFGISAWSVRSLSLLFSLLTILVLYNLGKKIVESPYSILLVLFFIFSSFNHFHALEARTYSLLILLFVLLIKDLYQLIFESSKVFIQLAIWNALILYTHYLGSFIVVGEILLFFIFFKQINKNKFIKFFLTLIITIVLYLPGILLFVKRLNHFSDNGTWVYKPHWTELYGNVLKFFNGTYTAITLFLALLLISAFKAINFKNILVKIFTPKNNFIFLVFIGYYFGMYFISIVFQPIFIDRYLIFITPILYLIFVIVLKSVIHNKLNSILSFIFIIPMMLSCFFIPKTNREGNNLADFVKNIQQNKTNIIISPPFYDLTFLYHYNLKAFKNYKKIDFEKQKLNLITLYKIEDFKNDSSINKIIFIDANSTFLFPDNKILSSFNTKFNLKQKKVFKGDYAVYEYIIND